MNEELNFLQAIFHLIGRQTFTEATLREIVAPTKTATKQVVAYNLCDGTRTQAEIATKVKLDQGNFSRTVTRWISAGILIRIGESKTARLLHVYPLNQESIDK